MIETGNLTAVVLALSCILAFGVASTTLESTVSTKPAEVIDPDWEQLQIENQEAGEMKEKIERNKEGAGDQQIEKRGDSGDSETVPSKDRDDGSGTGGGSSESMLDSLLAFLAQFLILIPILVGALALVTLYYYRDRLVGLLEPHTAAGTVGGRGTDPWMDAEPSNVVQRAWFEMVRRLDVEQPRTKTPTELERAARDADFDPDAVSQVTRAFQAAAYGTGEVAEEHRTAAREALEGLDRTGRRGRVPR